MQTSLFYYDAFLPITQIKLRVGVIKYSKCMASHVMRDITMPRTVWMVSLWINMVM